MANKPVPVLTGNPRIDWVWVWVWRIPTFSVGYGDVHIPAIILVPAISPFSFKLLKYSQLIK